MKLKGGEKRGIITKVKDGILAVLEAVETLPQGVKPTGLRGKITARFMAIGHQGIYKNVAAVLNLQPEDDFLEISCGSGLFIKSFASHVHSVAGVDHSEDMVKLASYYNQKRIEAGTAEFRHGDAAWLPWENDKFNAVTTIASFLFWPEPLKSLKEMYRVLRPGGRAVVSIGWNAEDGQDHSKYVETHGMRLYTGKEIQDMFQEAGFSQNYITYFKSFMIPRGIIASAVK
ncbi:putative arsenite methyltransferase [ANME-1 cluster archaeon GoMg1]|nr:putative arsenite methyltransferase [ANME-1 cluster archaeon GoMg1]